MKTKEFNSINILPAGNGVYVELNKSGDNTAPFVFTSMEELNKFLTETIEVHLEPEANIGMPLVEIGSIGSKVDK